MLSIMLFTNKTTSLSRFCGSVCKTINLWVFLFIYIFLGGKNLDMVIIVGNPRLRVLIYV